MRHLISWKRHSQEQGGTALAERPHDMLTQMRRELDSLFDRFFGEWPVMGWGFDVDNEENEIVVRAEAPGFEPGDFNVEIVGESLVLKAEYREEEKKGNGHQFRHGSLYRMISLPRGVDPDKISARYQQGVLEVHVPKGAEAKGKRITVQAG